MPRYSIKWLTILTVLVTAGAFFTLLFGPEAHGASTRGHPAGVAASDSATATPSE